MSVGQADAGRGRVAVRSEATTARAVGVLAVLMALAAIVIYRKGLGTTFFFDEWEFVIDRQPWRSDIFLTPYNGHLSIVPVLVYKLLFATVGLGSYWVYRLVLIAFHLTCVALVFAYARRRVGDAAAVCVAALLLFLGAAWHDLLVPFQIGFLGSVAGGVAMFLALDRRTTVWDVVAGFALVISLASSTLGVSFALAGLVELLVLPRRWPRVLAAAIPFALYLAWYVDYRNSPQGVRAAVGPLGPVLRANAPQAASYVASAAASAFGALIGLDANWGELLAIAAVVLLVAVFVRRAGGSARLLALLVAALSYWGLLAAFRAQLVGPGESRYLYGGAVLILLVGVELARGRRLTGPALAIAAGIVVVAAVGNYQSLRVGSLGLQDASAHVREELGALEVAGHSVDPNYVPDQARTQGVHAGPYLAVVQAHGSPADSAAAIATQPEPLREEADAVLVRALGVSVGPSTDRGELGTSPRVVGVTGGRLAHAGGCWTLRPGGPGASIEVALPGRSFLAAPVGRGSIELRMRHFAASYGSSPLETISRPSMVEIGRAKTPLAWYAQLAGSTPFRVCGARGNA